MQEIKDIFESIQARISAPYFGYMFCSFVVLNWKALFFLLWAETKVPDRIVYFETHTSFWSCIFWPVVLGFSLALLSPWLRLWFTRLVEQPTNDKNLINVKAEYTLLEARNRLANAKDIDQLRVDTEILHKLLKDKEQELIKTKNDLDKEQKNGLRLQSEHVTTKQDYENLQNTHKVNVQSHKEFADEKQNEIMKLKDSLAQEQKHYNDLQQEHNIIVNQTGIEIDKLSLQNKNLQVASLASKELESQLFKHREELKNEQALNKELHKTQANLESQNKKYRETINNLEKELIRQSEDLKRVQRLSQELQETRNKLELETLKRNKANTGITSMAKSSGAHIEDMNGDNINQLPIMKELNEKVIDSQKTETAK